MLREIIFWVRFVVRYREVQRLRRWWAMEEQEDMLWAYLNEE